MPAGESIGFASEITLGNIITWGAIVVGGLFALAKMKSQGDQNARDLNTLKTGSDKAIDDLRTERERAADKIYGEIRREVSDLQGELRREIEIVHKRQDKHNEALTDAINALVIETRAMHKENTTFREKVASEYVTTGRLADVMGSIRIEFQALGQRIDNIVARSIRPGSIEPD
jgi:uncharacterized protein YjbJ (UPF0337 family)